MRSDEDRSKTDVLPDIDVSGPRALVFWPGGTLSCSLAGRTKLVVGRSGESDLCVEHSSVSRMHVALHVGPPMAIEDLGSSNGTRVNGKRLPPNVPVPFASGAVVEVGLATMIVQGSGSGSGSADEGVVVAASAAAPAAAGVSSTQSTTMDRIHQLIDLAAPSRITVLILGETGVGKEVLAERLHRRSPRVDKPLVRLHCAAMPEALLESELFGYERGAFTGAQTAKQGLIESATGGTVFLDEIGELPPSTQAKLLRVLETREVQRIGSLRPVAVDIRFVAATHRDLEIMSNEGGFRADLYHRLNGISVTIPPLRDRPEAIGPLVREFVARARADANLPPASSSGADVASDAMDAFLRYPWPGNIRELRNTIERAVLLAQGGSVTTAHLPPPLLAQSGQGGQGGQGVQSDAGGSSSSLKDDVKSLERQRILDALNQCAGNQTQAAKMLGMSRGALVLRLDAYGFSRPRKGR